MPKKTSQHNGQEKSNYEFRVYTMTSGYTNDLELLVTLTQEFKCLGSTHPLAEEYARNIGLFGLTIEDENDTHHYYPPTRIAKVEYEKVT